MSKQIFVNLHVKDLNKSVEFFKKIGYTFNPQFTDENATCMVISDTIYVMLLVEPFFKGFTEREIADTSKVNECTLAFSCESKDEVDATIQKAVDAGGTTTKKQEYDFMYGHGFRDLDGHIWEYTWMDPSYLQK